MRPKLLGRSGSCRRKPLSKGASVSSAAASMYTTVTDFANLGNNPAFISDDLPQPLGPYNSPTEKVLSASLFSIRVFQKRMLSGRPSRSLAPGNNSRKKSASVSSKERKPLGTIMTGRRSLPDGVAGEGNGVICSVKDFVGPVTTDFSSSDAL